MSNVDEELVATFDMLLSSPLGDISGVCASSRGLPDVVEGWNLPHGDQDILVRWGVPIFKDDRQPPIQLFGDVQTAVEPEINDYGYSAYRLGTYWRRVIGALVGSGIVIGFPEDTSRPVSFINSSVAAFVEISWYWEAVSSSLLAMQDYKVLYNSLAKFKSFVYRIDPAVRDNPDYEWWNGIIDGW